MWSPREEFPRDISEHGYCVGLSYEPPTKSTDSTVFSSILPAELLSAFSPPTGPAISPPLTLLWWSLSSESTRGLLIADIRALFIPSSIDHSVAFTSADNTLNPWAVSILVAFHLQFSFICISPPIHPPPPPPQKKTLFIVARVICLSLETLRT